MLGFPEQEHETAEGEGDMMDDDEMKGGLNWQRAFRMARRNGHGNGRKGVVAPNAPDDDQRRERERRLQEMMERYLAAQFERIRARV